MRHKVYGKHLSRDKNQRNALIKSLVRNFFLAEKIQTTKAKAQAIKGLVDKLINQAKVPSSQRHLSKFLAKEVSNKLIQDIAPRFSDRVSGYASVIKLGKRAGDGTMMVQISLVEGKKIAKSEVKETKTNKKKEVVAKK
ncbi:50S ribosomal protein L17 [Candidatus Daviesbacteria bacterium]|nr:50S ribosomal protein L17 [Candidatus Daviesbacteria bacterium]